MALILIIDDDQQLSRSFAKILSQDGHTVATASTGNDGIVQVKKQLPDVAVVDIRLPDMDGIEVFEVIHEIYPKLPVIIITAFGTTETAIVAIQKGAYDYIYKPFDVPEMLQLIEKAIIAGRCMSTPVDVNPEAENFTGHEALVGGSKEMLEVYKAIGRVAPTDATVLIRGESGTGKELASRAIYNHSLRLAKPYVVINCVAIPETLLESELFGYEKGTFTGAMHRKVGKIEQARGGTVFLDEIGDMPLNIQAKFLRLLQENNIERLGGKEPIDVDVRIIAATNRDLESAVAAGTFREDLYYRLRVVTINLPALRHRKDDILSLCHYLLMKLSYEMSISNPGITDEAAQKLQEYDWPGNIRELSNILKKALIFNRGAPILQEELAFQPPSQTLTQKEEIFADETIKKWLYAQLTKGGDRPFDSCLDHVAAMIIRVALSLSSDNRSQAARILGISRPTLHAKMEKFGISSGSENLT